MSYTTADGHARIMSALAVSVDHLANALGELEGAYELLDEHMQDVLEEQLFRPVQLAYGRAQKTYREFGERYGLETRDFQSAQPGAPARGAKGLIELAVAAAAAADQELAELQDSMVPVEVGDAELRAGLGQVRELIGGLGGRSRELLRTFGR